MVFPWIRAHSFQHVRVTDEDASQGINADMRSGRARHIPVVILTSSAAEQDLRVCYDHYANSFLSKPVDFEKFHKNGAGTGFLPSVYNKPPADVA